MIYIYSIFVRNKILLFLFDSFLHVKWFSARLYHNIHTKRNSFNWTLVKFPYNINQVPFHDKFFIYKRMNDPRYRVFHRIPKRWKIFWSIDVRKTCEVSIIISIRPSSPRSRTRPLVRHWWPYLQEVNAWWRFVFSRARTLSPLI